MLLHFLSNCGTLALASVAVLSDSLAQELQMHAAMLMSRMHVSIVLRL